MTDNVRTAADTWWKIHFTGVVQGVGFRPTAYRVARSLGIVGRVRNTTDGACIIARCDKAALGTLIENIRQALPPIARIDGAVASETVEPEAIPDGFAIDLSGDTPEGLSTDVSPDVAICDNCLADMRRQPRRRNYFLTNCTNCGPRFSIVSRVPYDRSATSMEPFELCDACRREYTDPADRRYHAQPVCCHDCGPHYTATLPDGTVINRPADIISLARRTLKRGRIIMVKGVGGYNLFCNATSRRAVGALRLLKSRPRKPFVVMMRNVAAVKRCCRISDAEESLLKSWRAPVVVVGTRRGARALISPLVGPVSACQYPPTLGIMLPYMGFHHALFGRRSMGPVVCTSANRRGNPIITDDADALRYARENKLICIGFNRTIVNRQDDSVVRLGADGRELLLRRSRGYVPEPVALPVDCSHIMAMGADVTSQWALGRGNDVIQSPYIGSLLTAEGSDALKESVESMTRLFRPGKIRAVAVDCHPAYESRHIGLGLGSPLTVEVNHHHAHAMSVMADLGLDGLQPALVLDGTGYGPDGLIHGSELMIADYRGFTTLAHGDFLAMPGGDIAAREPWRMAVSLLERYGFGPGDLPPHITGAVGENAVAVVRRMIQRNINCPLSCGAGRLWDAVAALLGLALRNGYEAEAPLLLENLALNYSGPASVYPINHKRPLDLKPMTAAILADLANDTPKPRIAMNFHLTYAAMWAMVIGRFPEIAAAGHLLSSGGVMQNEVFVSCLGYMLGHAATPVELLRPRRTPCNDACIALGQMAYAAHYVSDRKKPDKNA